MGICTEDLQQLASLAKLPLLETQISQATSDFDHILSFVAVCEKADTQGVKPLRHPCDQLAAVRKDEAIAQNHQDSLQLSAASGQGHYLVPPPFAQDESEK